MAPSGRELRNPKPARLLPRRFELGPRCPSGLRDAGYVYMGIGEAGFVRNVTDGQLTLEFPQHWTDGNLRHIASWLHERGFKFSLGISPGNTSCTGEVGVCGPRPHNETLPLPNHCHAQDDVRWTVAQGTDHFPSDWCQILPTQTFAIDQYRQIWQAIESTGRNVTFGMYIYGEDEPWTWAPREHDRLQTTALAAFSRRWRCCRDRALLEDGE